MSNREYWVVSIEGDEVSGPYASEQDANTERNDRQDEWDVELIVTNTDDAY